VATDRPHDPQAQPAAGHQEGEQPGRGDGASAGGTPSGPSHPVKGEVGQEQQDLGALSSRRTALSWMSVGLSGLAGAVVSVPILSYLLSPLIRPSPRMWVDVDDVSAFQPGATVLRSIKEFSPVAWAGQTAETAVWVRRAAPAPRATGQPTAAPAGQGGASGSDFTVFAVNCTHLGCPVNWQAEARIFLCPCHGGVYYADGSVAGGPPPRPLFRYETRVQGTKLQVRSLGLQVATP
jgi:menaquinol-cytochrome c reductase iron-sulfur subunit